MARTDTLNNFLTDVADAIRSKTETTGKIPASEFDARIAGITTGGGTEDLSTPLSNQNTAITNQESKIATIISSLQGKASGGGSTDIEDAIVQNTLEGNYSNNRITKVGYYTFYENTKITGFDASNVTEVGDYAFRGCSKLVTLNLPKATKIGQFALYQTNVPNLYLPEVTTIANYSIAGSSASKTITLPKLQIVASNGCRANSSVTRIDLGACTSINETSFYGCSKLVELILRTSSVCSLSNVNAFTSTPIASGTGYIYVPDNLVNSYKTATNWSTYASQIKSLSELEG